MRYAPGLTIESAMETAASLRETYEKFGIEAEVPQGEIVILADEVLRLRALLRSPEVGNVEEAASGPIALHKFFVAQREDK